MFELILNRVCLVRSDRAGVFFGKITAISSDGKICTIQNSRRVWRWEGAASISQLAASGTSKPNNCKFPEPVGTQVITDILEYIPMTETAINSLQSVPVWKL